MKTEAVNYKKIRVTGKCQRRQVIRMREILFRGKTIVTGRWIEGLLWKKKYDSNKIFISYFPDKDDNEDALVVDPETVCQFTGLLDKNGVKIFEGDICRNIKNEEIVSVRWHGTMAGYVWNKRREDNKYLYNFGELFRVYDKYEVIGNIFDNPELMEGGESNG